MKAEIAREFENICESLPRSIVACLSVVPVGMGKGRPRFEEDEFDEGTAVDSGDGKAAGGLLKGKIVALATVSG